MIEWFFASAGAFGFYVFAWKVRTAVLTLGHTVMIFYYGSPTLPPTAVSPRQSPLAPLPPMAESA